MKKELNEDEEGSIEMVKGIEIGAESGSINNYHTEPTTVKPLNDSLDLGRKNNTRMRSKQSKFNSFVFVDMKSV